MKASAFVLICVLLILSGCSTTQEILLAKSNPTKMVQTIARSPGDSDAADMNKNVDDAFAAQGIEVKSVLPPETRNSPDVDAIYVYSDQWRCRIGGSVDYWKMARFDTAWLSGFA